MPTSKHKLAIEELRMRTQVTDPSERRRRLRKVYDMLLQLAERAEVAASEPQGDHAQPVN